MNTTSLWKKETDIKERAPLPGDITVNTAVIGGGMSGILTAYLLKQKGIECVVLEEGRIASGQTGNTTAKVTSQHHFIYADLIGKFGEKQAQQYARANQQAIHQYGRIIQKKQIECGWKECPAYLYSDAQGKRLRQEYEAAMKLRLPADLVTETELPFPVRGALRFDGQARFQPLKFLQVIAEEVTVYEGTRVIRAEEKTLFTNRGKVTAENIVFACHYPFVNVPGYYFLKMHQERSYVIAVRNAARLEGIYLGADEDGLSFRNAGDLLLIGGGAHRTGENKEGGQYEFLRHKAWEYWPDCEEIMRWSAQDCMTLDQVPYIGRFSHTQENWYVATGFGKWGMTTSMVSAMILSDQICGEKSPYEEVFSPQRVKIKASARQFLDEGAHAAAGLLRRAAVPPKELVEDLKCGHGGIVDWEGEKTGVYKDEDGHVYAVSAQCPHLGCQLAWNPEEKSFDCPCHGSRFDYMGRKLNGPAQEDIPTGGQAV